MLHGIFVGIDAYDDVRMPPLSCARRDAEAMASLFARIAAPERELRVLVDRDATRSAILRDVAVRLPKEVAPDDIVLLYFACHGVPEIAGPHGHPQPYLITRDTDCDNIYGTGIDMASGLRSILGRVDAKLTVLVIDSCFGGSACGRLIGGGEGSSPRVLGATGLLARTMDGVHYAARAAGDVKLRSQPISLDGLQLGEGQVVLAASRSDQPACEDPRLGHGVFTHCLLSILSNPDGSKEIPITQIYEHAYASVRGLLGGAQLPVLKGDDIVGAALPRLA